MAPVVKGPKALLYAGSGTAMLGSVKAAAPGVYAARTTDVAARRRVDYWTEAFGAIWGKVELASTADRPFYGALRSLQMASLRVNRLRLNRIRFRRLKDQAKEPFYSLTFPQSGRSAVLFGSDRLDLAPGAGFLLDNTNPGEFFAPDAYKTLNVQIPVSRIRERLGTNWKASSIKMESESVALALLRAMVDRLCQSGETIDLPSADFLDQQICDLVAFCFSAANATDSEEGALLLAHRERTDRCIRRLYARPDLSPSRIAAACGISARYLHKVYRGTGRTVMAQVKAVRLEAAHGLLRSMQPRSFVSEVAYDVGFKSLAEFSRAYKRRFGVTPRHTRSPMR